MRVPFAELGVPPEAASSWLLPERMGWQRASAMLLASEWIDADQAVDAGLALRVCPAGTVLGETMDLARRIASFPPHATRQIKRLMMAARRPAIADARAREEAAFAALVRRPRAQPGFAAHRRTGSLSARAPRHHRLPHRSGHGPGRAGPWPPRSAASTRFYLPEHTHLPVRADQPPALVEGVDADDYRRSLDPIVALATAASVTRRILLGTGVVLVAQHDPIVLAKQLATLDHLSGGRVVLGIGFGWNREEAADHGVAFEDRRAIAREHVLCMQALWSRGPGRVPRRATSSLDQCWSWPKPVQQPRIATLIGGGANRVGVRGGGRVRRRVDARRRSRAWPRPCPGSGGPSRTGVAIPDGIRVVPFGTVPTDEKLAHYQAQGIGEVVLRVPSGSARDHAVGPRRPRRLPGPFRWRR